MIEMSFALGALVVLVLAVDAVSRSGQSAYRTAAMNAHVEGEALRALERVARELATVGDGHLFPDPTGPFGVEQLEFEQVVGVTAGAPDWGPLTRLAFEYARGEVDDGIDNDGNGLIDDGVLVLTRNVGGPNEQRVVLCRNLAEFLEGEVPNGVDDNGNGVQDEEGFNLHRTGDLLTIRVTVAKARQPDDLVVRTAETSIKIRN